jgi:HPt (histidine-containing phosphotransfer) domain-containing protein
LNTAVLRQNLPDLAKAKELLVRFKPILSREIEAIKRGIAKQDWKTVRFHTHRIRSGSLYLGIESVGFPAAELEELIDTDADRNEIEVGWRVLHEACQHYLNQQDAALFALIDESKPASL